MAELGGRGRLEREECLLGVHHIESNDKPCDYGNR